MNREQAKELLSIIQAFAEGRAIELKDSYGKWVESDLLAFDLSPKNYRIKRGPEYRPFKDAVECWQEMQKHKPFGWVKDKNKEDGTYVMVTKVSDGRDDMVINGNYNWRLGGLLECFTFADGTPFGIKEE